jgi:hypothetical protein
MAVKKKKKIEKKMTPVQPKSLRQAVSYARSRTIADIKQIRLLWRTGMTDLEVREELGLNWKEWKRRVRIMRSIPPDDEVVSVMRRYIHEHNRTIARMEMRMKDMEAQKEKALEEIEVFDRKEMDPKTKKPKAMYTRPRNLELASTITKDLAVLDRELLKTNQELIAMQERLGMIDHTPPAEDDSAFDDALVITSPNLMVVWDRRKKRELERKKQMQLNGPSETEDAVLVERPNVNGTDKVTARRTTNQT